MPVNYVKLFPEKSVTICEFQRLTTMPCIYVLLSEKCITIL